MSIEILLLDVATLPVKSSAPAPLHEEQGTCDIGKDFRRALIARLVLIARAYENPFWHYENQEILPAAGACPKYFAIQAASIQAHRGEHLSKHLA